jgi:hypothetical protein
MTHAGAGDSRTDNYAIASPSLTRQFAGKHSGRKCGHPETGKPTQQRERVNLGELLRLQLLWRRQPRDRHGPETKMAVSGLQDSSLPGEKLIRSPSYLPN